MATVYLDKNTKYNSQNAEISVSKEKCDCSLFKRTTHNIEYRMKHQTQRGYYDVYIYLKDRYSIFNYYNPKERVGSVEVYYSIYDGETPILIGFVMENGLKMYYQYRQLVREDSATGTLPNEHFDEKDLEKKLVESMSQEKVSKIVFKKENGGSKDLTDDIECVEEDVDVFKKKCYRPKNTKGTECTVYKDQLFKEQDDLILGEMDEIDGNKFDEIATYYDSNGNKGKPLLIEFIDKCKRKQYWSNGSEKTEFQKDAKEIQSQSELIAKLKEKYTVNGRNNGQTSTHQSQNGCEGKGNKECGSQGPKMSVVLPTVFVSLFSMGILGTILYIKYFK